MTGEGAGQGDESQSFTTTADRSSRPFIAINCAALPEGLLESEMFGHRKGPSRAGAGPNPVCSKAPTRHVFLDELVEMPSPIPAKLLRVIQDGVVRRVRQRDD